MSNGPSQPASARALGRVQLGRVALPGEGAGDLHASPIRIVSVTAHGAEARSVRVAADVAGFEVTACETLAMALTAIEREAPDLVLVGTSITDSTPSAAIRAMHATLRAERTPLVAIVARVDADESGEQALLFGATDLLVAPLQPAEVVARVRTLARMRRDLVRLEREYARLADENAELRTRAIHDPVTGLCNLRHLEKRLAEEVERAYRYGQPLTVVALDLDHFAALNAAHDRTVGDRVLRAVGMVLSRCARQVDVVARTDEDTFVIVAPATPSAGARVFAERVRGMLERTMLDVRGDDERREELARVRITASFGVATLTPELSERIVDALTLATRAEDALARAKEMGRNRVE